MIEYSGDKEYGNMELGSLPAKIAFKSGDVFLIKEDGTTYWNGRRFWNLAFPLSIFPEDGDFFIDEVVYWCGRLISSGHTH